MVDWPPLPGEGLASSRFPLWLGFALWLVPFLTFRLALRWLRLGWRRGVRRLSQGALDRCFLAVAALRVLLA